MKKNIGSTLLLLVPLVILAGCREDNAVISTTNMPLGGLEGRTIVINTNDPDKVDPVVIDTPGYAVTSISSLDEKKVFIAQRRTENDLITVVDSDTKIASEISIESHTAQIRHIWDMALSGDGSKLIVGTRNSLFTSNWIEIYDTSSLQRLTSFILKRHGLDYYRIGQKLAVNPVKDEFYAMVEGDKVQPVRIRAMNFSGEFIGDDLTMNADHWDYNYGFGVSANGKLLIGVSDKIYPFDITEEGLMELPSIAGKDGEEFNYYGKIKVLFSEDFGVVYITSSGVRLAGTTNLGGVYSVLNVGKILAGDPDPFIHSTVDFIYDDVIKWVAGNLSSTVGDLLDPIQLYGIADATMVGNTIYMVIASVNGLGGDLVGITEGKYILSAFETMPFGGQVWLGGKVLTQYPESLTVNSADDTIVVTYPWDKRIDILKKEGSWLTPSSTSVDLGSIEALGAATYPKKVTISSVERK